jgi:hypothetical protein
LGIGKIILTQERFISAIIVTNDKNIESKEKIESPSYLSSVITSHPTNVIPNHVNTDIAYDLEIISNIQLI